MKALIIIAILVLVFSTGIVLKDWDDDKDGALESEDDFIEACPNFDGRKFLLSGGSKKLTNQEELQKERIRLNYICDGDN